MAKQFTYDYIKRELLPRKKGTEVLPSNDKRTCYLELNPRADEPTLCPKCSGTLRWNWVDEVKIEDTKKFAAKYGFRGADGMGVRMNSYTCEECSHSVYVVIYIFSGNEPNTDYIKWPPK